MNKNRQEYVASLRRKMARFAWCLVVFTWLIAMLGAYVRLSDAGLGCPDWPGCYGHWYAPVQAKPDSIFPHSTVEPAKAWKEMAHRYGVSLLSCGIVGLVVMLEYCARREQGRWVSPLWSFWLIAWLVGQALFGMWTVTLKLMPAVVTGHLLGGMLLLVWLVFVATQLSSGKWIKPVSWAGKWGIGVVWALVFTQVLLGGWVSTHYAAGACGNTFPLCRGFWEPNGMRWGPVFEITDALGYTSSGDIFPAGALVAIHWMHRIGAGCVTLGVVGLAVYLIYCQEYVWSILLVCALDLQIFLGFANIHWNLPLPIAVAHNGGAALLLALLTALWSSAKIVDYPHVEKHRVASWT